MDVHKVYVIDAAPEAVWAALTDPEIIEQWGGGPAVIAADPGSEFSLWDGYIHGTVLEVRPHTFMVQEWYGGEMTRASQARFDLTPLPDGGTRLELTHTGLPDAGPDDFDAGWDEYYLGAIKELLDGDSEGAGS